MTADPFHISRRSPSEARRDDGASVRQGCLQTFWRGIRGRSRQGRSPQGRSPARVLIVLLVLASPFGAASGFVLKHGWQSGLQSGWQHGANNGPRRNSTSGADAESVAIACRGGQKTCAGRCVPIDEPAHGCGGESCASCDVDNATARCGALRRCEADVCHKGFADCDGNRENGCEANLRIDPDHCGRCDVQCPPLPNAERGCGGRCTIWRCDSGFRDCNAKVDDGCEIDVTNDLGHCGGCGRACSAGQRCEHARCT